MNLFHIFAFVIVNYRMKHPLSVKYYLDYMKRLENNPEYKRGKIKYNNSPTHNLHPYLED